MTTWNKISKATGTSWTNIAKPSGDTTPVAGGTPIGLLLALTYGGALATSKWTKIIKASGTTWTKITKAT